MEKINLVYIDKKGCSLEHIIGTCRLQEDLPSEYIGKKMLLSNVKKTIVENNSISFIVLDLTHEPADKIFDPLTKETLLEVKKSGLPIIMNLITEAFDSRGFEYIYNTAQSMFPANRKYILNGNLRSDKQQVAENFFSFAVNYFEYRFKKDLRLRDEFLDRESISQDEAFNSSKSKDFVCFNGRNRPGRISLISELVKQNLHKNSYFTYLGYGSKLDMEEDTFHLFLQDEIKVQDAENFVHGRKYTLDVESYPFDDRQYDKTVFLNSFFSLVTETENLDKILFLTEKTYKPIYTLHPFLMWSSRGHLSELKNQGYETFPDLFDESYDDMAEHKRLCKILDNVKDFKNLSLDEKNLRFDSVKPKLLHNREVFLKKNFSDYHKIFWNKILEIIKKERELTNSNI